MEYAGINYSMLKFLRGAQPGLVPLYSSITPSLLLMYSDASVTLLQLALYRLCIQYSHNRLFRELCLWS